MQQLNCIYIVNIFTICICAILCSYFSDDLELLPRRNFHHHLRIYNHLAIFTVHIASTIHRTVLFGDYIYFGP